MYKMYKYVYITLWIYHPFTDDLSIWTLRRCPCRRPWLRRHLDRRVWKLRGVQGSDLLCHGKRPRLEGKIHGKIRKSMGKSMGNPGSL